MTNHILIPQNKDILHALERAIEMTVYHGNKLTTPEDPYGGLMLLEDADLLKQLRTLLAAPCEPQQPPFAAQRVNADLLEALKLIV